LSSFPRFVSYELSLGPTRLSITPFRFYPLRGWNFQFMLRFWFTGFRIEWVSRRFPPPQKNFGSCPCCFSGCVNQGDVGVMRKTHHSHNICGNFAPPPCPPPVQQLDFGPAVASDQPWDADTCAYYCGW
jgi:hypothetical protein